MLIDLHNHTSKYSDDSLLSPEHLIESSEEGRIGRDSSPLSTIFFWDHEELVDIGKSMDFLVIPGVEINTDEGHLLVFRAGPLRVLECTRHGFLKDLVDKKRWGNVGGASIPQKVQARVQERRRIRAHAPESQH